MPWGYTFREVPERVQTASNGRVNLSVHLRMSWFEAIWHCFGMFYGYLALFGHCTAIWHPENVLYLRYSEVGGGHIPRSARSDEERVPGGSLSAGTRGGI